MYDATPKIDEDALTPWLQGRSFDDWYAEYDDKGYVILEGVMPKAEVDAVRSALTPHFTKPGRNDFEGFKSNRVYALLAKAPDVFAPMAMHPLAMAFVERELGTSCLLSAMLAINLHPGESVQDWHIDDNHINIPLPRQPFGVSTFWAIDAMTDDNGATEIIPGSHKWTQAQFDEVGGIDQDAIMDASGRDMNIDPKPRADAIKATMPAGSLMVAKSTLMHRGGANKSDAPRLIVTPQYCTGWSRQLENMVLTMSKSEAAALPRRVQELMGYSIHGMFMGYADGEHPAKVLKVAAGG